MMAGSRRVTLSPGAAAHVFSGGLNLAETFRCMRHIMNLLLRASGEHRIHHCIPREQMLLVCLQGSKPSFMPTSACPVCPANCFCACRGISTALCGLGILKQLSRPSRTLTRRAKGPLASCTPPCACWKEKKRRSS